MTLVDGHLYSTFQPLLYQVATAGLNPGDVAYPAGGFVRRYGAIFRHGDWPRSTRRPAGSSSTTAAISSTTTSSSPPACRPRSRHQGAAENTFSLYTRTDAIALRDHLMAGFDRLSVDTGDLSVTVVGGEAPGAGGTLAELRGTVLGATFPDVDPFRVHVRLVEMALSLLGPFHEKLRDYAKARLLARDFDVRLNTKISEVTANQVRLADGEALPSDITVWAAGETASPAVAGGGCPRGNMAPSRRGRPAGAWRGATPPRGGHRGEPGLHTQPQLAQPALDWAARRAQIVSCKADEPFKYH